MNFLFWNLHKKPLLNHIATLTKEYDTDIFVLAETEISDYDLLIKINTDNERPYTVVANPDDYENKKIRLYSRLPPDYIRPKNGHRHMVSHQIFSPIGTDFLLISAHLPSKLYQNERSQTANCPNYVDWISAIEQSESVGHSRTVFVGDLNMNPFEWGLIMGPGFHAVMDSNIAAKGSRIIQGNKYQYFYNPMWSYFGDISQGPPGTYYKKLAQHDCYFWNIFDQVLIRPGLLDYFDKASLKVVTKVGDTPLLKKETGLPNTQVGSDHLPLVFKLKTI